MNRPLKMRWVPAEDWGGISGEFEDLTYEQTLGYSQAAAKRIGADARFLSLSDHAGRLIAAACLRIKPVPVLGRGIAWIAAGPLVRHRDNPDPDSETLARVFSSLRTYARDSGHILRFRMPAVPPLDPGFVDLAAAAAGFGATNRSPVYRTVAIDCRQPDEELMRCQHGKWRNPLRNALKAGMETETLPIAECAARFNALYRLVSSAKGFSPDIPPEFYYPLKEADFSHKVLFAMKDGVDLGAMTIGAAASNGIYLFGATTDAGRRSNTGHFLMWQAIQHCKSHGLEWFDLGGIDPENNPGVTQFKLRTGGVEIVAPGPYQYQPPGLTASLISLAETVHQRVKGRG